MQPDLAIIIKYLEPGLVPMVDYVIEDASDGIGPFIAQWNVETPTQPTQPEIDAARPAALAANLNTKNLKLREDLGPSVYKMDLAIVTQIQSMIGAAVTVATPQMQTLLDELAAIDAAYPVT